MLAFTGVDHKNLESIAQEDSPQKTEDLQQKIQEVLKTQQKAAEQKRVMVQLRQEMAGAAAVDTHVLYDDLPSLSHDFSSRLSERPEAALTSGKTHSLLQGLWFKGDAPLAHAPERGPLHMRLLPLARGVQSVVKEANLNLGL